MVMPGLVGKGKVRYIHNDLRLHQFETLQKIRDGQSKFSIVQAPTGSGKSFLPLQLAYEGYKVMVLVKSKSLQRQYASYPTDLIQTVELFGKGNYDCLDQNQQQKFEDFFTVGEPLTADLCTTDNKARCREICPYSLARQDFIEARSGTLNYQKFLLDYPVVEAFHPDYLFLDEAHELSDLVVEFSGVALNWRSKNLLKYAEPIEIDPNPQPMAVAKGIEYLQSVAISLKSNPPLHPKRGGDVKFFKWHERLLEKLDVTLASLKIEPTCWYVYSDREHFVCKPLTARFHFQRLFDKAPRIVMMSATIGKPQNFVRELGIKDYEFVNVPWMVPAPMRPIYDLKAPAMGWKMAEDDRQKWASIIRNTINDCPDWWTGIVHVTSKNMAYELADRMNLDRPVYVPPREISTEECVEEWESFYHSNTGAMCIAWQLGTGADLGDNNLNIVAKVPYPTFAAGFDKSRFDYDRMSSLQRVANDFQQREGRIRRGYSDHYGATAQKKSCIADGRWPQVRNFLHREFIEAIV